MVEGGPRVRLEVGGGFDEDRDVGRLGKMKRGLSIDEPDRGFPGGEAGGGIGAYEVLEEVGSAVLIRVPFAGWIPGGVSEFLGGPGGEVDAMGEGQDPGLDEGDAIGIGDGGGEGRHLADAAGAETLEQDGTFGVSGHDHAVGVVAERVVEGAIEDSGEFERGGVAGVPSRGAGTAGQVAGGAIDLKVGAGAEFEGGGKAGFGSGADGAVRGERDGAGGRVGEVPGGGEGGQLVNAVGAGAIELGGVEAEGPAGGRGVAGEAFGPAGIAPGLGPDAGAGAEGEELIAAFVRDEFCAALSGPSVGKAIDTAGVPDEEAGLEAACR